MIITASGNPLGTEAGSPVLFPGIAEARNWMMAGDQGVEEWLGGIKPPPDPGDAPQRET